MRTLIPALLLALSTGVAHAADDYQLGDRLESNKSAEGTYKDTDWDSLMPKDWDPMKAMQGMNFGAMQDGDPRAIEALKKLQEAWNNAPVNPAMNGARVRIPGFVVPLDGMRGQVKEFLLVPYFGACIHTPPPPANQVIHVIAPAPVKGVSMMDAVWVSGAMKVERSDTGMGQAGYRIDGASVQPYREGDKPPGK